MKLRYANQQDKSDLMNGTIVTDAAKIARWLNDARTEKPHFVRLTADSGFELMVGVGRELGCVQYSRSDGDPPYLMALSSDCPVQSGGVAFLTANTPTPVPARNILSFDELRQIVFHFFETGKRSEKFTWEEI